MMNGIMISHYEDGALLEAIKRLKREFFERGGDYNSEFLMNTETFIELKKQAMKEFNFNYILDDIHSVFGIDLNIDDTLPSFKIYIREKNYTYYTNYTKGEEDMFRETNKLPFNVYFSIDKKTKKEVTILEWNDSTKTIARCDDKDEFNAVVGFLYAYFYKHCGYSKVKAKKYLDDIKKGSEKQLNGKRKKDIQTIISL